jgi:hypothetical protein
MDDKRSVTERLGGIEGADPAALGVDQPPESAPAGAGVSDEEHLVPGADFAAEVADEVKPWSTSLAAESDQAGVANDPIEEQEPQFPESDDPR